jgi:hypothetical protein
MIDLLRPVPIPVPDRIGLRPVPVPDRIGLRPVPVPDRGGQLRPGPVPDRPLPGPRLLRAPAQAPTRLHRIQPPVAGKGCRRRG